jgi:membrane protein
MTDTTASDTKTSARRPEGPAHARKGSLGQTLKRTLTEFKEDELTDRAAALTYYAVLSIFPALIALVSIVGLVGDPKTVTDTLTKVISQIGPASAVDTFKGPIDGLTKSSGTAGIALIVGIAAALWTASGYVGAFMRAANVIYEVEEGRSIVKLRPLQMLVTLVLVVLLALVLVALVLTGPLAKAVGSSVGVGGPAVTVWDIAKWPVLAAVVVFMITLLYYASPNAKLQGLKSIVPGAACAARVARRVARLRILRRELRLLQQDLRRPGRGHLLPRVAMAHQRGDPARRRAQRRARAIAAARGGRA